MMINTKMVRPSIAKFLLLYEAQSHPKGEQPSVLLVPATT